MNSGLLQNLWVQIFRGIFRNPSKQGSLSASARILRGFATSEYLIVNNCPGNLVPRRFQWYWHNILY